MKPVHQRIDQYLLDAIEESLGFLGEPVKNQIFTQLECGCSINREALPENIEIFSRLLYRLFGSNAKLIEIKCMKAFYSKIQQDPDIGKKFFISKEKDFTFPSYIDEFKQNNLF
jgi:hypothetical protein